MKNYKLSLATRLLTYTCLGMLSGISADGAVKPNIVLIMADDLGYESIGVNGARDIKTPTLDRLAETGIRFEQCFANPKCTPSRVKLMTGQYNVRNYKRFGVLERTETTIAHQLKEAGYVTAIAGKWQLGNKKDSPQFFGFDESCLWQQSRPKLRAGTEFDTRYPNPELDINGKPVTYSDGEYGPDVCADFICDFIEKNKDKPFFAYYPMILTHCPFDATPDSDTWDPTSKGSPTYKGPKGQEQKHFKEMVQYADKLVGKITSTLDRLGLRENTLIIFTGDNGTDRPIKTQWKDRRIAGAKGQVTDAGTRVPLIVNWPGVLKPKVQLTELVEFCDFMPTLCDFSSAALPDNYAGDGVSLKPILTGEGKRDKPFVYIWYRGKTWARTVDYGVLLKNEEKQYTFQKFSGHYEVETIDFSTVGEKEQTILSKLKLKIDELAKTRPTKSEK